MKDLYNDHFSKECQIILTKLKETKMKGPL